MPMSGNKVGGVMRLFARPVVPANSGQGVATTQVKVINKSGRQKAERILVALSFGALILSAALTPAASATRVDLNSLSNGPVTISGGGAVLYELHTATWCTACADFDDIVEPLRSAHAERMAFVALHPDDDDDKIGNSASQHRLNRLHSIEGRVTGTPTSFMEGELAREGKVSGTQISLALFDAESQQRGRTSLSLTTSANQNDLTFQLTASLSQNGEPTFNGTQLTIMVGDDDPEVKDSLLVEGAGPFHAALSSLFEVDINENGSLGKIDSFPSGSWEIISSHGDAEEVVVSLRLNDSYGAINDLTILAAHEASDENLNSSVLTHGAISFFQGENVKEGVVSWEWIIFGLLGTGGLIVAVPAFFKGKKVEK